MDGERARRRRKELKISGETIAQKLRTTKATVSRWESGISEPDDKTKIALAKLLNTTVSYLIGETNNPMPYESTNVNCMLDTEIASVSDEADDISKETIHQEKPGHLIFRHGNCLVDVPDTPSNQAWFRDLTASVLMSGLTVGAPA